MNIPHRSVSGLSGDEVTSLNGPVKNHDSYRVRRRSPLLFCRVPENPASTLSLPRSGAPPEPAEPDTGIIGKFIKEHPIL